MAQSPGTLGGSARALFVHRENGEKAVLTRIALTLCAMTFLLVVNAPAHADWRVVQWFYGDCKIGSTKVFRLLAVDGAP